MVQTTTFPGAQTSMITFGDRVNAFLAVPEHGSGPFPAMILSHERYGLVQHTIDLAAKFAKYGYVGIAPDLFSHWEGDRKALVRGDVRVIISDYEIKTFLGAAFDFLVEDSRVDSAKISSMGVCQSGEYPIVLNSVRPDLAANIVVYGGAQAGALGRRRAPSGALHRYHQAHHGARPGHLGREGSRGVDGGGAGPAQRPRVGDEEL